LASGRVDGEDDETGAEGAKAAALLRSVATEVPSHQISAAGAPRRILATSRKEVCAHGRRRGARSGHGRRRGARGGGTTGGARAKEEGEGGARVPIYRGGRPGDGGQEEGLRRRTGGLASWRTEEMEATGTESVA